MDYRKAVKTMAKGDRDILEKGDVLIKEMCKLITEIMDYRYASVHYKSTKGTVMSDKVNQIRNATAVVVGDLEVYAESLGITDSVQSRKVKRIIKIAQRAEGRKS